MYETRKMLLKDFYTVVDSSGEAGNYQTSLKINKGHELYKGHFPERPVTPGVILMQLFKEEAQRQTGRKLQLKTANNVKFTAVVDPNQDEILLLESEISQDDSEVNLKGVAKNNNTIALKISAIYTVKNEV